jgi:RelE-like toxin of type II toxin-antitoxin system HigB
MLDAAETLADVLVPPGNRLEKLTGDRGGQDSIRINQQWRICFRWSDAVRACLADPFIALPIMVGHRLVMSRLSAWELDRWDGFRALTRQFEGP